VTDLLLGHDRIRPGDVARIARGEATVGLTADAAWRQRMQRERAAVISRVERGEPFYGVNTGFGASVVNSVSPEFGAKLAVNLFRFHGTGVGPRLALDEARAILVTRLAQLSAGWSGIRIEILEAMVQLLCRRRLRSRRS